MKLKEAYRYSNCLATIYTTLNFYLSRDDIIMNTREEHMRSQSDPNAKDETVDKPNLEGFDANRLLDLLVQVVEERDKVTKAIAEAKDNAEIDIDQALSMNKWKKDAIKTLEHLAYLKPSESIMTDTGYKLDAEGKQTSYVYSKKVVRTIAYDRNMVRNLLKKYQTQCDEASSRIEEIEINTEVDFEPQFDMHMTIADLLSEDS